MDQATGGDSAGDDRLHRPLPPIGQHAQYDVAAALNQAEDGRLVLRRCATSRRAFQPAPTPEPPLLATAAGWPLWPATTQTSSFSPSPANSTSGAVATRPWRSCSVMA